MALFSPGDALLGFYRWTTALLLATVFVLAARALAKRVSLVAGLALLMLLALSPWMTAFGPSIYWQPWTLLLPTLLPLLLWPRLRLRGWWPPLLMIAGAVMLKALCGYEFITTVILGATAGACYHEYRGRFDLRLLKAAASTVAVGIAGFAAAMAVHAVQLWLVTGSLSALGIRARQRTFGPDEFGALVADVRPRLGSLGWLFDLNEPLALWLYFMRGYLFEAGVSTPTVGGLPATRVWIGMFCLFYLVTALWLWRRRREGVVRVEERLAVATGIGLVGALSWLVLAYGHAINHAHLDAIVFYIPFLPFCYSLLVTLGARALKVPRRAHG
jgi:hypothetical protein